MFGFDSYDCGVTYKLIFESSLTTPFIIRFLCNVYSDMFVFIVNSGGVVSNIVVPVAVFSSDPIYALTRILFISLSRYAVKLKLPSEVDVAVSLNLLFTYTSTFIPGFVFPFRVR